MTGMSIPGSFPRDEDSFWGWESLQGMPRTFMGVNLPVSQIVQTVSALPVDHAKQAWGLLDDGL